MNRTQTPGRAPLAFALWLAFSLAVGLAVALLFAAPAEAQTQSAFSGQVVIGYRSVDVGGRDAKFLEDVNLEDGPRLFDLDVSFVPSTEDRTFADRVELNIDNFGGDPFETLRFGVGKAGAYSFSYDRRKSDYFYNDIILPPALANVRQSSGGDFHNFDFERVQDTAKLGIDVSRRAKINVGFDRFLKTGEQTTTIDIQRDEFEFDKPIHESLNAYHAGFEYAWDKVTLVLEEQVRDYENEYEIFLPGFSLGENTTAANASLDFFFLDQPYEYSSNQHTVRLLARPNDRFSVQAAVSLQTLDMDIEASERSQGKDFTGVNTVTTNFVGEGEIDRDFDFYDVDLTYLITDKVSLVGSFYQKKLDQSGEFSFGTVASPVVNRGEWQIDTTGAEAGVQYAHSTQLVVTGGLRFESRDVEFGAAENAAPAIHEESTDHDGYFAKLAWKPIKGLRVNASLESDSFDDPFALASPTDRNRYSLRGQYNQEQGFFASATYVLTEIENDTSDWTADSGQATLRFGYQKPALTASIGYSLVEYDREVLQPVLFLPATVLTFDIDYEADADFLDGQVRWAATDAWTLGATVRFYENDGSFGVERDDAYGFVEYGFEKGYLVRLGYRTIDFDEEQFDFDDYDANIAEFAVGYRW